MFTQVRFKKGFTLIEVLVVVAIIGILVSILTVNFSESRKQSRDKVRKSDLKSMQLALELYKAQNSSYPGSLTSLVPDFIPQVPVDPSGGAYTYTANGTSYKVITDDVESQLVSSFSDEFARCPRAISPNCPDVATVSREYAVYSVGAEGW